MAAANPDPEQATNHPDTSRQLHHIFDPDRASSIGGTSMAVSYEQACEIVRELSEPGWTHGTFCLDDRVICENDEFYVFNIGAREFILDGDLSYAILGGVTIVFKEDGKVASRPSSIIATDPSIRTTQNPNPTLEP